MLLATDAAGEGLNLQQTCRFVINLELPWNPMRLEQRIGRVDRIGQRRPVHVVHLIARGSGESQVLSRLQSRVARVRADIGGADPLGVLLGDAGDLEADFITHVWGPIRLKSDPTGGPDLTGGPDPTGGPIPTGFETGTNALIRLKPDPTALEAGTLWTPSLDSDAQAEAGRIAMTRMLAKRGDEQALARLEGLGPAVSRARRWRTRAELGGRTVMVWQIVATDAVGRVVGSTLVPVIVADASRLDDEEVLARVNGAADTWRERAAISHHAFIGTRLIREQAVLAEAPEARKQSDPARSPLDPARSAALFQPGLFERRGERAHSAAVAAQDAADRDRAERMAAIERALPITFLAPQLRLVLTP